MVLANREQFCRVQLVLKDCFLSHAEKKIEKDIQHFFQIDTGRIKMGKIFYFPLEPAGLSIKKISVFSKQALCDPVTHEVYVDQWPCNFGFSSYVLLTKLPGVTDDEAASAQKALNDYFQLSFSKKEIQVCTQDLYLLENFIEPVLLEKIAYQYLGNPLLHHFEFGRSDKVLSHAPIINTSIQSNHSNIEVFHLNICDDSLMQISKERHLSLNLEEMKAIKEYYLLDHTREERKQANIPLEATDCELEILGQTWSEHCKHKGFNALIEYQDEETGETRSIDSLFQTKICAATEIIQKKLQEAGHHWLVKCFTDNAGVVRIDEQRLFIWKVETHNTPSALDPYGGAITGILGNNRDALGTGRGGARLLFNTNVLCFAPPTYSQSLLPGQLHPLRILRGVVDGIMDGGNKSGVPTVNGSIVFDDRFSGKPLVFCGTGAIMPSLIGNHHSWEKPIEAGDCIVVVGGRVGKDGIHGATLSSSHVDVTTPTTIVQIGSPFTQKLLSDFLEAACLQELVRTCTDNGAGGLSSSVGELAQISGGALVHLEKVPLKYFGMKPWEIFLSESQERMTLVVKEVDLFALMELANEYEVEASFIGTFTSSGFLDVRFQDQMVAYLDLDFLHKGVPQKKLEAKWQRPFCKEPLIPKELDLKKIMVQLLSSWNVCSKEKVIRRYDHEVKGKSVIKPLMGLSKGAPQDAAIIRLSYDDYVGLAISNGICPRYGDIHAYHMSAGAFDEAVRQIIAVGGQLPDLQSSISSFWSVNDNFCLPDSEYDPVSNPEGKLKLAKLVHMCDALYDMSTKYLIPMTSGKDSMKNDFKAGNRKISVPPTVLYSMVSKIDDIRKAVTAEYKMAGDVIYLLGNTYDELGGSEFYRLFNEIGANVPIVRPQEAIELYRKVTTANQKGLLCSCHDISDGGLAVALAESGFDGDFGVLVEIASLDIPIHSFLFSETHSRFIISVRPDHCLAIEDVFKEKCMKLGRVTDNGQFLIRHLGRTIINVEMRMLEQTWREALIL